MATLQTTGQNARPRNPEYSVGKKLRTIQAQATITTLAAGDVLILGGPLTVDARVHRVLNYAATPALAGATSVDLGFYYRDTVGVYKPMVTPTVANAKNLLWSAASFTSAKVASDLLAALNPGLNKVSNIGDLLGISSESEPTGGIYVGMTFNTAVTSGGLLDLDLQYEEATTK